MAAEVTMERTTNLRPGKTVICHGTPAERQIDTPIPEVRALGSAKYVAAEMNNIGCDDALKLHAEAHGLPEYVPIWKRVADKITKGLKVPRATENSVIPGAPATAAIQPGSAQELAAQIDAFKDDPEMQRIVFERWQARRATPVVADVPVA